MNDLLHIKGWTTIDESELEFWNKNKQIELYLSTRDHARWVKRRFEPKGKIRHIEIIVREVE